MAVSYPGWLVRHWHTGIGVCDLCARDMCAQKHYDAFSHSKRRRVLVETLAEYFLEENSSAVESLPTGDRTCSDASSESA